MMLASKGLNAPELDIKQWEAPENLITVDLVTHEIYGELVVQEGVSILRVYAIVSF